MKKILPLFLLLVLAGGAYFYTQRRPHLTVIGYIKMADGLGRMPVELIEALKDEVSIGFLRTHSNILDDVPEDVQKIVRKNDRRLGKVIILEDCLWWPRHTPFKRLKTPAAEDQIRIAYSMFESSAIPPMWVSILNTYFDAVAVPDPFLVDVYKNSGVKLPIFVLPLGLDLEPLLSQPLKTKRSDPMVFANLSTCTPRKNQITLLRAFAAAFGNRSDVQLRLNSRISDNGYDEVIRSEIKALGLKNVIFTVETLPVSEYLSLFQTVDCYVNLAKGEGFSIQPREAMALGIPVICTNNTAQTTICETGLVRGVPATVAEPALYPWGSYYGHAFNCTVEDAAAALRDVYTHYEDYLKCAPFARLFAARSHYPHIRPLYLSLVKPKRVILGKENRLTADYLMTDSEELYKKYKNL